MRTSSWRYSAAYWVDSRDKVLTHHTTFRVRSKLGGDVDVVMSFMLSVWSRNLRTASCCFCTAYRVDSRDNVHAHPTTLKASPKL